jgi:geranylgeranyl pyrophosphate synthase
MGLQCQWQIYWQRRLDRLFDLGDSLQNQGRLALNQAGLGQGRRPLCMLAWARALATAKAFVRAQPGVFSAEKSTSEGQLCPTHLQFAGVVELIHLASLWHDDVVDQSKWRRGQPCLHTQLGAHGSVLWGDLVLAEALGDAMALGDFGIVRAVQLTVRAMAIGQLHDGRLLDEPPSLADRLWVARRKTGSLFALACWGAGRLAGACPTVCRALVRCGLVQGEAYQLGDDVDELAQPLCDWGSDHDFMQGRWTYPLVCAALSSQKGVVAQQMGRCPTQEWAALYLEPALVRTRQKITRLLAKAHGLTQTILQTCAGQ